MDIQAAKPEIERSLSKVGINEMHIPVKYRTKDGDLIKLETQVSMYVNLANQVRGISMSRLPRSLYEHLEHNEDVSVEFMSKVLATFRNKLESSDSYLKLRFNYPLLKPSLVSPLNGWMYYPVELQASQADTCDPAFTMQVSIFYNSTCPCSGHLARELEMGNVIRDGAFVDVTTLPGHEEVLYLNNQGGAAHGQRSRADIRVRFDAANPVWIEDVVLTAENAVRTAVQVLVRRPDEQLFSKLCRDNEMFVEDAARRISLAVDSIPGVLDWSVACVHQESLHPFNAVAVNWKGVPGGLR